MGGWQGFESPDCFGTRMAALRAFLAKNGALIGAGGVACGGMFAADQLYAPAPKPDPFKTIKDLSTRKVEAVGIPQQKEWDARYAGAVPHTTTYYAKCCIGGALACGLTHTLITPLDVTKCNMQVNPGKYSGMISGMQTIMKEEGMAALTKGWAPTLVGYSAQGCFKFGLYEFFKDFYSNMLGEENSKKFKGIVYLGGSASAEIFADVALCPFEMIKVKVQTSPPGTFPTEFGAAWAAMSANKAETRFPFGSVVPLWLRQIPYTMAKFFFFEKVVSFCYNNIFTAPKETYGKGTQLTVTFISGYTAGVICAIVSHPADTLVSLLGKPDNKGKSMGTIATEFGYTNLMMKGLFPRILMIGTMTGVQWYIYDAFKTFMGMGTTGGK